MHARKASYDEFGDSYRQIAALIYIHIAITLSEQY